MTNEAGNQGYISAETVPSSGFSEALGALDGFRRRHGANSEKGFAASNVSEILRALPTSEVAPNAPPRSTICQRANLLRALPIAQATLADRARS